jgi:hypothetical protein
MSPELIKINKKVDCFREVLSDHGFENLQFFWYNDGRYNALWKDMSVAAEKPDIEESLALWQFGFRSQNLNNKRIHLEAIMPVFEDYFTFELRYYPEVRLNDEPEYSGPTARLEVSGIQEKHLTNLQKYINYLLNIE